VLCKSFSDTAVEYVLHVTFRLLAVIIPPLEVGMKFCMELGIKYGPAYKLCVNVVYMLTFINILMV
jgi:hypothetical protein